MVNGEFQNKVMPPPKFNKFTKNHTGKLRKIQPSGSPGSPGPSAPAVIEATPEEDQEQLEVEIIWCVQKLDESLQKSNLTQKQADDINKSIRILKSATQPTIKKRLLMRNTFGDYRGKMKDEERRAGNSGRVQFQANTTAKSQFLRKAAIKPGEEFRFNFKVEELSLNDDQSPKLNAAESDTATNSSVQPPINTFNYQPSDNGFRFNFDSK